MLLVGSGGGLVGFREAGAAPARRPAARPRIARSTAPRVLRIKFKGNRRVESETILRELRTRVDDIFKLYRLQQDVRRIWGMGKFDDIKVDLQRATGGVVLTTVTDVVGFFTGLRSCPCLSSLKGAACPEKDDHRAVSRRRNHQKWADRKIYRGVCDEAHFICRACRVPGGCFFLWM